MYVKVNLKFLLPREEIVIKGIYKRAYNYIYILLFYNFNTALN